MPSESTTAAVARSGRSREMSRIVFAVLAAVIVLDQVTKWWAWRHAPWAQINSGGDILVNNTVGRWFADPLSGALLDLLDFGILCAAVAVLVRRRRPLLIRLAGTAVLGGWMSNVADRLGLHYVTAPGSVRGAVDFIPLGTISYNVADVFIVCGTVLFVPALTAWAAKGAMTISLPAPVMRRRLRARGVMPAIAGAVCLVVAVGFGAANYGGVSAPSRVVNTAMSFGN